MARFERAIMDAISHPDVRADDVRPGRERYFASGAGPTRWLRVVVEYEGAEGVVVTAFGQRDDP